MSTALIVTFMLNRYEHEEAERLMSSVRRMLPALCDLIAQARACEIPTVYINDNHGDWSAGRAELAEWAMQGSDRSLVEPILPRADTPFIVKARHSIFDETQLEHLLRQERIERVVLAGQVDTHRRRRLLDSPVCPPSSPPT
jgi:nicotinamidase-related amidase